MQDCQQNYEPIVLFYYKFRGQLQYIRNLLTYLALPFIELHIECLEEEKKMLSPAITQKLKGLKIDPNKLPMLVHQGYIIDDFYVIFCYICKRFNRNDLFGNSCEQKARFQQLIDIYLFKQPQNLSQIFKLSQYVAHETDNNKILKEQRIYFQNYMNNSGYIKQICIMLDQNECVNYIINGQMTVIDFFFYQSCNYILGLFNNLDADLNYQQFQKNHYGDRVKPSLYYLSVMRKYRNFYRNLPFFVNNREFLDSFSMISIFTTNQKALGLRKIWQGEPSFIK